MQDYYIRTPDHEESRGPFNISKLLTLGEAGQINENTLYYDEDKEEWMPFALNEELKAQVFPERKKLELKISEKEKEEAPKDATKAEQERPKIEVDDMLAAAEGTTEDTKHLKKQEESFQKAASIASSGIGLMMLFSAVALLMPHFEIVDAAIEQEAYSTVLNYPFVVVGLFDLVMAIFLFLAVTEIYPLLRTRGMLTLGFGLYVGWALDDLALLGASAAGGIGIFLATVARTYSTMLSAILLGIGGNGYLAYFALTERFSGLFENVAFKFFEGK
ncbi:MAG: hypothetical protein AAGH40_07160 [Verrucomicrobiota bacterium]